MEQLGQDCIGFGHPNMMRLTLIGEHAEALLGDLLQKAAP
jgi:hypothetical protein